MRENGARNHGWACLWFAVWPAFIYLNSLIHISETSSRLHVCGHGLISQSCVSSREIDYWTLQGNSSAIKKRQRNFIVALFTGELLRSFFVFQGKRTDGIRAATNVAGNFCKVLLKICSFSTATTTTECAKCLKMTGDGNHLQQQNLTWQCHVAAGKGTRLRSSPPVISLVCKISRKWLWNGVGL